MYVHHYSLSHTLFGTLSVAGNVISHNNNYLQEYGVDWDGPISEDDADQVYVSDLRCPITEEQYTHLQRTIAPFDDSEDYGIGLYTIYSSSTC